MTKDRKYELVIRSLGIRHKLKVHESIKLPDNHEDLAVMLVSKWELEDELRAIEDLLAGARHENVQARRKLIEKEDGPVKQTTQGTSKTPAAPKKKK